MMQGPIQRTVRFLVEPRVDARLPTAWVGGAVGAVGPTVWTDGTWLTRTSARQVGGSANAPVCVLLGDDAQDARAELLAQAGAGARVYALVGPGWGKEQADSQLLQAPRVLLRRLPDVPASAVHVGSEARLWIGGGFVLRLDANQAEALRQAFVRLFWHEATEEAWSGGRQFAWRPARERPFDVPEVPASASVRWEPPDARLTGDARGSLLHITAGLPPDAPPRRLWYPAGPDHQERLARLAKSGVEVLWADRGLPDLYVAEGGGEVLLPGTRARLRLRLTPAQAGEVGRLLEAPPAWRFHADLRLGELNHRSGRFWLPGEGSARGLEAEQLVEVADVQAASLRAVPDTTPASFPAAQPLALAIRYQWTVVPPRVPVGAEEDALVGRWGKLDEDWHARLKRLRDALVAAEGDRGRIVHTFSRLVSAMLGFERTNSGLLARVEGLATERPSRSGPSGAPTLLAQLEEIENAARKLQADLNDAESNARAAEELAEQQKEWETRTANKRAEAAQLRSELEQELERQAKLAEEAAEIEAASTGAAPETLKDLDARRMRNSDERKATEASIKKLRYDIKRREEDADTPFAYRPKTSGPPPKQSGGARFVPPTSGTRPASDVPDEALPAVGSLRRHKGQRYLVIESWEQLDAGEQAASRLSAKLVAPENA